MSVVPKDVLLIQTQLLQLLKKSPTSTITVDLKHILLVFGLQAFVLPNIRYFSPSLTCPLCTCIFSAGLRHQPPLQYACPEGEYADIGKYKGPHNCLQGQIERSFLSLADNAMATYNEPLPPPVHLHTLQSDSCDCTSLHYTQPGIMCEVIGEHTKSQGLRSFQCTHSWSWPCYLS